MSIVLEFLAESDKALGIHEIVDRLRTDSRFQGLPFEEVQERIDTLVRELCKDRLIVEENGAYRLTCKGRGELLYLRRLPFKRSQ